MSFARGFIWGVLVFAPHFIWLFILLLTKSCAPLSLALAGYSSIVLYYCVSSGIWFWLMRLTSRWCCGMRGFCFLVVTVAYYYFIDEWSLVFVGYREGYPFFNPLIALSHYKPVLWLVASMGSCVRWVLFGGLVGINPLAHDALQFMYQAPVMSCSDNYLTAGQKIYQALAKLPIGTKKVRKNEKPMVIITPETFYPFSLNHHPEQLALWTNALPQDTYVVIGSQRTEGHKFYQAAYLAHNGLIKKYYVKCHCTPFVEKIPKLWRFMRPLREAFLKNSDEFSRGKQALIDGTFALGGGIVLIPQICSELFFKTTSHQIWQAGLSAMPQKVALVFLVNDSWFVYYFKRLLQAATKIKAAYLGIPIMYIGHTHSCMYGGYN